MQNRRKRLSSILSSLVQRQIRCTGVTGKQLHILITYLAIYSSYCEMKLKVLKATMATYYSQLSQYPLWAEIEVTKVGLGGLMVFRGLFSVLF